MPKAKKKLKPTQVFEYKLTLKTYGEPLKYYGFKDIIRRLFRESLRHQDAWKPCKKHKIAKTENFCAICLDTIHVNQHIYDMNCSHQFHKKCFLNWCKSKATQSLAPKISCPMCRQLQDMNYKQENNFVAVTQYTVDDQDTLIIERNVIPESEFHS